MSKADSAANNSEATSPTTRQPRTAPAFTKAVKLHMKQWGLGSLQSLLVIICVTLLFLLALLAETLILMVIHWSSGKSLTHPLFAAKLLEGLQLLSALGTALAYLLYLMRSLFKEAKQVVEERQPKESQMGYTRLKRDVLKTLQDARHTWITLAVGIAVTSMLYATLTTAGLAASASLLVAFSTLVGLLLLNLLVDTKASSLNLLQAARTLLRKATRFPKAEPLYQRALAIYEKLPGTQHPDTAQSLNNLALLYTREGRYEQAEPLYQRALAICEKRLGAEHPHTRTVQENYTRLLQKIQDEREPQS